MTYNNWLRVKTVARAWPTWIITLSTVAALVADEVVKVAGADSPAAVIAVRVAAILASSVTIIRLSTPVLKDARGILPTGEPVTSNERYLSNELAYTRGVLKDGG